jgi:tRNA(Arg) A34 adenosine deaminase TadA
MIPSNRFPTFSLSLPRWIDDALPHSDHRYQSDEEKMAAVITLARLNVHHGSGGPFGAAIFDAATGTLLAPGVNLVVESFSSAAHAEVVACTIAQTTLRTHALSSRGRYELFTSCEPCAMCLGAIPWAGLTRVIAAARDEDARAIGFDEGVKATPWGDVMERHGITVKCDVLREEARQVLRDYSTAGALIY